MMRPPLAGGVMLALILTQPALAAPGYAALDLPGAGPVSDVAQTTFRDGFAQRIGFRGNPRGVAEVSVRNGGTGAGFGSPLSLSKPSQAGIAAELLARFPGDIMRVVTEPRRNAYGPVGMALGSDCLYAWQWIDLAGRRESARASGPSFFSGESGAAASIRIKLCRTGTATLADLARSVERMRFWASARDTSPALEAAPAQARSDPPRRRPSPNPPAKKARPTSTPSAMERPRAVEKPEVAETRRTAPDTLRYLTPGPGAAPPVPAAPATPGHAQAPRYITDGTPQAAQNPVIAAPKPAPNRAEIEDLLARELPARAYRPPP